MQNALNSDQKKATEYGDGPLLIIAGAGTGKTTVITERIKHFILNKNIAPKNLLALTFTEKAAAEMQERVDIALPLGYSDMWIHTFHAFCDRILRNEAIHIGLNPGYKMMTETQSVLFLRNHLFELKLSYFLPLGNPDKFLQGLLQHFSRLKDEDITPEMYMTYAKKFVEEKTIDILQDEKDQTMELATAYEIYENLKKREGVMDFGDLLANTLFLFRKRGHILKKYQRQFRYILVDEFQDTNFSQNALAILLAGEKKNITVVGDDDQAIYRWRGAAISNMMQFKKNFPETKIITLTKNYRSSQTILNTAYAVIQHNNPDRLEVQEKLDKKLVAQKKSNNNPIVFSLTSHGDAEAEYVVEKIQYLINDNKYSYKDFAILVRANDHAQSFVRALERFGIPHQFLGPEQLFQQEEIKDLIAFLKVMYDTTDNQSFYRLLTMEIFDLHPNDISILLNAAKKQNKNLYELMKETENLSLTQNGKEKVTEIITLLKNIQKTVHKETAGQILYNFFNETGLLKKYIKTKNNEDDVKAQNIAKFFERLKKFETQNADASVFAVVDWLDLSMQMGESPLAAETDWSENDAVNILTIHSSKGLEFPVVFVVNLVTQRFPSRERSEQIPIPNDLIKEILPVGDYHMQEERRLFYVATTRAKDLLFLTASLNYGDGKRSRKISPFVAESVGEKEIEIQKEKIQQETKTVSIKEQKEIEENAMPDRVLTKVTYLSYSQIQTFDICPLHYKLKYILKIPTKSTPAQSYGISVHNALKEYYLKKQQGDAPTAKDIKQILQSVWISEGYISKAHEEEALRNARANLQRYTEKNNAIIPAALEVPFQFSLEKIKIGGRIDRIDSHTSTIDIIDYKTGRKQLSEKELTNNLQLTLYALAATKIPDPLFGKNPEDITLSLHYLETGDILHTKRAKEQLLQAEETLRTKTHEIENSDFTCSKSIFCENCEYSMLCKTIS